MTPWPSRPPVRWYSHRCSRGTHDGPVLDPIQPLSVRAIRGTPGSATSVIAAYVNRLRAGEDTGAPRAFGIHAPVPTPLALSAADGVWMCVWAHPRQTAEGPMSVGFADQSAGRSCPGRRRGVQPPDRPLGPRAPGGVLVTVFGGRSSSHTLRRARADSGCAGDHHWLLRTERPGGGRRPYPRWPAPGRRWARAAAPPPPAAWVSPGTASARILRAQQDIGRSWRIGVDTAELTELVTRGLYGGVRNPVFSFMILAAGPAAWAVPNAATVVGASVLTLGAEMQTRLVEEPYLRRRTGTPITRTREKPVGSSRESAGWLSSGHCGEPVARSVNGASRPIRRRLRPIWITRPAGHRAPDAPLVYRAG